MKNHLKTASILVLTALFFMACNKEQSVQEYYIENQENGNFIAIDLPASIVNLGEDASEETKETLATIKKLNVIAFKITESNKSEFEAEYAKVKKLLKGDSYNELMRMKHEGVNVIIKYQGSDEAVDEFILLAAEKSQGFALARVIGNEMQPEKIIKMAEDFKNIDQSDAAFAQLGALFEGMDTD